MTEIDEPWIPPEGADDAYRIFPKTERAVADDGTALAYSVLAPQGARPPVLLANGWSCSDAYWAHIAPLLVTAGHPCVIIDTRGHGLSGLPRSPGRGARNLRPEDLSMERVARDMVTVLDHAGIDEFIVLGHSMGVQTGLEVERLVPERTLALILMAGTFENPARTFYGLPFGDLGFPLLATTFRWLPEIGLPVQASIGPAAIGHLGARMARAAGPKATAKDLLPYLLHLKHANLAVMMGFAAAMRSHSAADLLPTIDTPTLIVSAGSDVFTPARCSETMHHRIPASEMVTFPAAGHTLPIEEPEGIVAAVDEFLHRRVPAAVAKHRANTAPKGEGARDVTARRPAKSSSKRRTTAERAAPAKESAPAEASAAKKAAPAKKAATPKKSAATKKATPAKKAVPARKSAAAKKKGEDGRAEP